MKLPKWIQRKLDSLPARDEVMGDMAARQAAIDAVECLNCTGRKPKWIDWVTSMDDDDELTCLNCLCHGKIVRKQLAQQ